MLKLLHLILLTFALHSLIACSDSDESSPDAPANPEDATVENPDEESQAGENPEAANKETASAADESTAENNEDTEKPEAIYLGVPGSFVLNINDGHILQIKIQLQLNSKELATHIRRHKYPPIQSALNNLFSTATYEEILTMEGKEAMRKKALQEVLKVMNAKQGDAVVEDVLFTNVIVQ